MNYQEILEYDRQQKQKYEELEAPYKRTEAKINELQEKIEKLKAKKEKQIKIFEKKEEKLEHRWTDTILKPIAEEVIKKFDNLNAYKILGCHGIYCQCPIFFYKSEEDKNAQNSYSLTQAFLDFEPSQNGVLIWTGETTNEFAKDTLGAINGGNKVMEEVTSLEQIFKYVEKSLKEHKEVVKA